LFIFWGNPPWLVQLRVQKLEQWQVQLGLFAR
jgi:hypothetical protein